MSQSLSVGLGFKEAEMDEPENQPESQPASDGPPPLPPLNQGSGRRLPTLPRIDLPKVTRKSRPISDGKVSTRESTDERKVAAELATAAVGALSLVILAVQVFGPRRNGNRLREPSKDEYKAIAIPVGRILARHIPTMNTTVAKDIADLSRAIGATKEYLLTVPFGERERLEDV